MRWDIFFSYGALLGAARALECSPSAIQAVLPSTASVNFAYPLAQNSTFQVPSGDLGWPTNAVGLPSLCAVSVQVQSIGNSSYGFGLFLPVDWNGRFLAVGNGAFGGGINWEDMGPGTRYGFATMSTDTGHNSTVHDGRWAYQQPEKVENWGHLAMHGSVVTAKAIVKAYYDKPIAFNYYAGCSTGGRQGLKEAERYPEDFDGILAGAPAWWTNHLQPWTLKMGLYNLPTTADYHIPPALFPTIAKEVLSQCDPQDGLVDNIISDPAGCKFSPQKLLCPKKVDYHAPPGAFQAKSKEEKLRCDAHDGVVDNISDPDGCKSSPQGLSAANVKNDTSVNCLTYPQISTLYKIYNESWSESQTGAFPSLYLGTEDQWGLFALSEPNTLGTEYVKYFLGLGPDWSFYDYNADIERLADRIDPGNATVKPELSAFQAKGGKLLAYHGLSDGLIPAGSTKYFYHRVQQNLKSQGIKVDDFFRWFPVPGMHHCSGTPTTMNAPWYFAGPNQALVLGPTVHGVPGFEDKEHDALLAIMAWVEEGIAPEHIIATKYVNDTTHDAILRQRPLCVYPKQAKYIGRGDVNEASSWKCRLPN